MTTTRAPTNASNGCRARDMNDTICGRRAVIRPCADRPHIYYGDHEPTYVPGWLCDRHARIWHRSNSPHAYAALAHAWGWKRIDLKETSA